MNDYSPSAVDTTQPRSARVWNYLLGGKHHFPVDREYGDKVYEVYPEIADAARSGRAFLARVVRYLAGEAGTRQFLDIGSGLPIADNTHDVAQRVAPDSRIVYVDNDPMVLAHAEGLLAGTAEGATAYIDADVRAPETILTAAAETLDFTRPIAVMLMGIMGNIADLGEAYTIVRRLKDALPSGSYVVLRDSIPAPMSPEVLEALQAITASQQTYTYYVRTPEEIAGYFDGVDLVEPGLVSTTLWRPDPSPSGPPAALHDLCGVGRKP
jgi:hypothetical protein